MEATSLAVRRAAESDWCDIWRIFRTVVAEGTTYMYDPAMSEADAHRAWMEPPVTTFVAENDDGIVGTYILRANQPGLGSHVANAGFMVSPHAAGQGIGRAMCRHALDEARQLGYQAMQFNAVVSNNHRAVGLWLSLGFTIVGTVPRAFHHRTHGLVDIHIMHRFL